MGAAERYCATNKLLWRLYKRRCDVYQLAKQFGSGGGWWRRRDEAERDGAERVGILRS